MIKKVEVLVSFPVKAKFYGNLDQLVYHNFIVFIKKLTCFNINARCKECDMRKDCFYYKLSGENNHEYPGIIMKTNFFSSKTILSNEDKIFDFYFLGDCQMFTEYVSLYFTNLNQMLFGNFFYLKNITESFLSEEYIDCNILKVSTFIESTSFTSTYNNMIHYYNQAYNTSFKEIEETIDLQDYRKIQIIKDYGNGKKSVKQGYVGNVNKRIKIPQYLLEIGIGKYNSFGGGHLEN